jgi:hypothetical protein
LIIRFSCSFDFFDGKRYRNWIQNFGVFYLMRKWKKLTRRVNEVRVYITTFEVFIMLKNIIIAVAMLTAAGVASADVVAVGASAGAGGTAASIFGRAQTTTVAGAGVVAVTAEKSTKGWCYSSKSELNTVAAGTGVLSTQTTRGISYAQGGGFANAGGVVLSH